jgi:hypothetical protein
LDVAWLFGGCVWEVVGWDDDCGGDAVTALAGDDPVCAPAAPQPAMSIGTAAMITHPHLAARFTLTLSRRLAVFFLAVEFDDTTGENVSICRTGAHLQE